MEKENIIDRIDTIKANSVSDEEYERVHGKSLVSTIKDALIKWDELIKKHKPK